MPSLRTATAAGKPACVCRPARSQRQRCLKSQTPHAAIWRTPLPSPSIASQRARTTCQALPFVDIQSLAEADANVLPVYVGLGAAATSFLATFLVAPQFKEAFKEATAWKNIYRDLKASDLKTIAPGEAYLRAKRGSALLDVRLASKWEESRAECSVNIPLYLPIKNWDLPSIIRRLGFAFFGIFGTELNTTFAEEVSAIIPKGREVLLLCESGGSLDNKSGTQFGFQSRSLKAAWYLQQAGFSRVVHVQGGLSQWVREELPMLQGPVVVTAQPSLPPIQARGPRGRTISERVMVGTRSLRR